MNITFKDVGQGDSIIIEWKNSENELCIGLVDCNKKGATNPVLDYLSSLKDFVFQFIILSHPHDDHFSGMLDVLNYLESKSIPLSFFLHTCVSNKAYLTASVRSNTDKTLLKSIFQKAQLLHEKDLIHVVAAVNDITREFELESGIFLKFLGPTQSEYDKYNARAFKNENISRNNPDANLISTFIKISSKDSYLLLTADAPLDVFWNYMRKGKANFNDQLLLGQIPHHGAEKNFHTGFWRAANRVYEAFACISVGENNYGHPHPEVLKKLLEFHYKTELTGEKQKQNTRKPISYSLDAVSRLVSSPMIERQNDLVFQVTDGTCLKN